MKSDVIVIKRDGTGLREALAQADAVAAYKNMPHKAALHLRLLTEELAGMVRAMTGNTEAKFWIEDEQGAYKLHLKTVALITDNMRGQLMSVSSSGKNIAAKGFVGKMLELIERAMDPVDLLEGNPEVSLVLFPQDPEMRYATVWTLSNYRTDAESGRLPKEEWDELEKSIVVHLAEEVEVGIRGGTAEVIVTVKRE